MEQMKIGARVFNLTDVEKSYSGRNGCMCGCKGKYNYMNEGKERGIKTIIKNMDKIASDQNCKFEIDVTEQYICVELDGRTYAVYFKDKQ